MRGAARTAIGLIALFMIAASASAGRSARWHVARSAHFILYSEQDPAALRAYAERLERFDAAMRIALHPPADTARPVAPVTMFILSDDEVRGLSGWSNVEGLYRATAAGAYAFTTRSRTIAGFDASQNVLLHEYSHHFMLNHFPANYPDWFIEGFAEYMASARFNDDGSVDLGVPSNDRGVELKSLDIVPLADMMAGRYKDVAVLEAKGWLLTHYLTFAPGRSGQLARFLDAINHGEASPAAAERVFGDLAALDRELSTYVRRKALPFLRLAPQALPVAPVTIADAGPIEVAMMQVRIKVLFDFQPALARQQAIAARRIAAAFPHDGAASCLLAQAEDRAGRPLRAEAAADDLLARKAASSCGMIYKGRAIMARAALANLPAEASEWSEARRWFARANRAAGDDPWPMALYYQSFLAAHAAPTANAVAALFAALDRAPQDRQLRYMATIELLRAGRSAEARIAFAPLVSEERVARYRNAPAHALLDRIGHSDPAALAEEFEAEAAKMGVALPG